MDKGGYTGAPHKHSVGDLVDSVWSVIHAKEKKYGERRKLAVHLLLYSVDWRFLLSESCIALLRRYCVRRKQHFVSIAYYAPITLDEGILWPLFPVDEASLPAMDEAAVRSNILKQGNPQAFVATPDGMGVQLQFPE